VKLDVVLVVSDAHDGEAGRCVERLRQAEVRVELIADVYAATARLAKGGGVAAVVVDARTLDDKELAFLRLVPHFFPRCMVLVPALPGLQDRAAFHAVGVRTGPPESLVDALIGEVGGRLGSGRIESPSAVLDAGRFASGLTPESDATPPATAEGHWGAAETKADGVVEAEEEAWESAPEQDEAFEATPEPVCDEPEFAIDAGGRKEAGGSQTEAVRSHEVDRQILQEGEAPPPRPAAAETDVPRLSTDGGPEAAGNGPSMHEVVRRRMAADQESVTRRAPPRSPPGGTTPQPPVDQEPPQSTPDGPGPVEPMLSPEELDALLADRDDQREEHPPWTGTRGKP
jgi:hypothetical protein